MDQLDQHLEACEVEMIKRCTPFFAIVLLISTLPGISLTSAMIILSEIGTDMDTWTSDKELNFGQDFVQLIMRVLEKRNLYEFLKPVNI